MTIETVFTLVVVIFTVANLAAMGLDVDVRDALKTFRNLRFPVLTLVWGWIVGPAIAYLIIWVLPLADAHAAGLLLIFPSYCLIICQYSRMFLSPQAPIIVPTSVPVHIRFPPEELSR